MDLARIKDFVTPAIAAVIIAGLVVFTLILFFAPPGTRDWLFGANGFFWVLVAYVMEAPARRRERRVAPHASRALDRASTEEVTKPVRP